MVYDRPWKSFEEQLALLEARGMVVGDKTRALEYLQRIGYYRLSAYWYPFRQFQIVQNPKTKALGSNATNQFVSNTHFLDAVKLYLFDKKLRLMVMDALERIEVALRVDMAYRLGERNIFAYNDQTEFHPKFATRKIRGKPAFEAWREKYAGLLKRSKEDFVDHYRKNHGPDLPIWVAIELWDFGAMSQLFAMMKVPDQQTIARKYGVENFRVFSSWLRSLNYLRNLVAHHSRLWNRNVVDQPKLPKAGEIEWCDDFIGKPDLIARPFLLLAICHHLVKIICPNTQWCERLRVHLQGFPELHSGQKRSLSDLGTVDGWEEWWK
jgi:abortive infection bacteriophage resistance protein